MNFAAQEKISIHTTLAGGDEDGDCTGYSPVISIHTTLAGGDWRICMRQQVFWISIHTTLAGGDCLGAIVNFFNNDFNPHHPRGWRLWITLSRGLFVYFNPHHPRGWRLGFLRGLCPRRNISIHTTLAGGDIKIRDSYYGKDISIHTTLAGGDITTG